MIIGHIISPGNIFVPGGGGGGPSGYLFYKINISAINGGSYISCAEIEALLASADTVFGAANSGTASSNTTANTYSPAEAFQCLGADLSAGWLTNGGQVGWLKWADAGTIDVRKFVVTPIPSGLSAAPKAFTFEYSDDDAAWTVAATFTNETGWVRGVSRFYDIPSSGAHKYWRINITAADGSTQVGLLSLRPVLADGSVVTLGTRKVVAATHSTFNNSENPDRLLDGVFATGWTSKASTSGWVILSFAVPTVLDELTWQTRTNEQNRSPKDFTIEGSNDMITIDILKTVTGETGWASAEKRSFTF